MLISRRRRAAAGGMPRGTLVAPGYLSPLLQFTRGQPGGAVATAEVEVVITLVAPGYHHPVMQFTRAQPGGAVATAEV